MMCVSYNRPFEGHTTHTYFYKTDYGRNDYLLTSRMLTIAVSRLMSYSLEWHKKIVICHCTNLTLLIINGLESLSIILSIVYKKHILSAPARLNILIEKSLSFCLLN